MNLIEKLRTNIKGVGAGILLTSIFGVVLLLLPLTEALQHFSYDFPHRFSAGGDVPTNAVIVYLDELSARELGQDMHQPWDRALHAQLLDNLHKDGAKAVAFDIIFSGEGTPESNHKFSLSLSNFGKAVLGADIIKDEAYHYTNVVPPLPVFMDAAAVGLVTLDVDENNAVREHWQYHPQIPSLSWQAALYYGVQPQMDLTKKHWVRYYGEPGIIPSASYYKAYENGLAPGFFRDKVVFVGAKPTIGFVGTGKDEFKTPHTLWSGLYAPGVEIHATSFLNLIRGDWIDYIGPKKDLCVTVLLGVLAGGTLALFTPGISALIAALLCFAILFAANIAWKNNLWFTWVVLLTQVGIALFWAIIYNSLNWYVQRRLMLETLAVHLSPARAKAVLKQPDLLKPGAEMHEISILFSDIENFSAISEKLGASELASQLNQYFETSISSIHHAEGTVVKLIGDAIFAIWNAPDTQPNHQILACRAALNLREQLTKFETTNPELVKFRTRVGLHTGIASVGNFGSKTRFDYTAMGDSVNLSSRLEGLNKFLGTDILISDDLFKGLNGQFLTRPVGKFRFKGFDRAIDVHELLSASNESVPAWLDYFNKALIAFQSGELNSAEILFGQVLQVRSSDGPSKFYLEQIKNPSPVPGGVIELKEK